MAESTLGNSPGRSGFRLNPLALGGIGIGLLVLVLLVTDIIRLLTGGGGLIYTVGDGVLNFLFNPNQRVASATVIMCQTNGACSVVHALIYSALLLFVVITGFAYTTLLERKFIAWFQQRSGPNRVGPLGLLQPAADAVKLITKEDILPSGAYKAVWYLAPAIKCVPVLIVLAVIPLGPDLLIPWFDGNWYQVPLYLADPSVGILWLLGITSIGTYGIVLAGWSSNNKYAMLGGLRATSQMLSYELTLGLAMAVPVMIVSSMALGDIVGQQVMFWDWFIFQNPLAAGILFIALLAEVSRAPFDLVEAEQELTAGFMTEYSGMKFALFMMAEYLGMIAISMIFASLYLGGYQDGFGLVDSIPILGPLVMIGKVVLLLIVMIWIRATLPRIRYDRLMQFGWKILLPLAIIAVIWTAVSLVVGDVSGDPIVYGVVAGVFFLLVVAGGAYFLRGNGDAEASEAPQTLVDDPVVTGDRRGIGWGILTMVGALIAIPFQLIGFLTDQLEKVGQSGSKPADPVRVLALKNPEPIPVVEEPLPAKVAVERRLAAARQAAAAPALKAPAAAPAKVLEASTAAPAAPKASAAPKAIAPAADGEKKPGFDKQAMLAKIREKKSAKGG